MLTSKESPNYSEIHRNFKTYKKHNKKEHYISLARLEVRTRNSEFY